MASKAPSRPHATAPARSVRNDPSPADTRLPTRGFGRRLAARSPGQGGAGWRRFALVAVAGIGWTLLANGADPPVDPLIHADTLRTAGQFDEALEVLRLESREIKRIEGENSPRLLTVNDLAAEILIDQGAIDKAATLVEKTIEQREQLIKRGRVDQNTGLGGTLLIQARLDTSEKRYQEAATASRRAVVAFDTGAGPNTPEVDRGRSALEESLTRLEELLGPAADVTLAAREQAAETFESLGMFAAAIEQRQKQLEALRDVAAKRPEEVLAASGRLGRVLTAGGRASEAAATHSKTMAAVLEPEDSTVLAADALRDLGAFQVAAEAFLLAEDTFRDLADMNLTAKRDTSRSGLRDRMLELAAAVGSGQVHDLPEWFAAAVNGLGRGNPAEAVAAAEGLTLAADVQRDLGNEPQAVEVLERGLAIAQAAKPPALKLCANVAARLALAELAIGDIPAARKILDKALPAAEAQLGPGDSGLVALRIAEADTLARQADIAAARVIAERLLVRGLPRPSPAWEEETVAVFDRLADKLNTPELDLRDRYVLMRGRQFGSDHPHVAAALAFFGSARMAVGDWTRGIEFLSRAATIQEESLGSDHPDLAATLLLLGQAERAAGSGGPAIETLSRSLATWREAVGPDHPGTRAALEALAAASAAAGKKDEPIALLSELVEADALDTQVDSIAKASHLVRLADLLADRDKAQSGDHLKAAALLPCWNEAAVRDPRDTRRLALVAALASHAFTILGERDKALEMLRRGRSLALELGDSKATLESVERIASRGDRQP